MKTEQVQKMTDSEYFAYPAVSASQIKAYDKGAYYFWKQSPFNPEKEEDKETDALVFGKLCHCLLLEPSAFKNMFAVCDIGATRRNKKYEDAKLENPGKCVVSQQELDRAMKMIANVKEHKLASVIVNGATAELPYIWKDEATGLMCKAKIDAIKRTKNGIVVIDYKTSSDIEGLLNWPQKLQYPLQAEFYKRAVKAKYGEEICEFVFIIQSNKEGEEDVIAVANVEYETAQCAETIVSSHLLSIKDKLEQWNETHDKQIFAAYPNRVEMRYSNWFMERGE